MGLTDELALVFGTDSRGTTVSDRARSSTRLFVRSQDHLATDSENASGRKLSAWEAIEAFGYPRVKHAVIESAVAIPEGPDQPASTIRARREALGLSIPQVASAAGLSSEIVMSAEDPRSVTQIRHLERVAQALALDETRLGLNASDLGDEHLGIRLRELGQESADFGPRFVTQMDEAAWVTNTQYRLHSWLGGNGSILKELGFSPDTNYGDSEYPAYEHGYFLASKARQLLGLAEDDPIENLRELIESKLNIPLIQLYLEPDYAGATIAWGTRRGIAVNVRGSNSNVWVRRATLAHELGHLLWDPDQYLRRLVVDTYELVDPMSKAGCEQNFVEARANAFAVEFLAPQSAVVDVFRSENLIEDGLRRVMETFGVSYTVAKYQVWNGTERVHDLRSLTVRSTEPTDEWKGVESFAIDFYKPQEVPISRRGRLTALALRAFRAGIISLDSMASILGTQASDLEASLGVLESIYPEI